MRPPYFGSIRVPVDLLQVVLARLVGGVRFSGENDLHWPARRRENRNQAVRIMEDQFRTLVPGEAAGEADRQRVRIEERPGRDDAGSADALFLPPLARALADEGEEVVAQQRADAPELVVRDLEDGLPDRGIIVAVQPSRLEVRVEQRFDVRGQPRRHVHAVGDRPHRSRLGGDTRPDRSPHVARDLSVELADPVDEAGRSERERRHVEERSAAIVVMAQREERIARGPERAPRACEVRFDEIEGEGVVPGRDRRVRGEDCRPPHFLERRVEALTVFDKVANALQDDEGGMPLVQMPRSPVRGPSPSGRGRRRCRE